jgi:PAS domain S-box-containing protein
MRPQLSLTAKVLLFVSLPLLIQLGLLGALAHLQKQAEDALKASVRSKAISDTIHEITADIFAVIKRYNSNEALENIPLDDEIGRAIIGKVWRDYEELKDLTKDEPELLSTVISSERMTRESLEIFKQLKAALLKLEPGITREKIVLSRRMRQGRTEKVMKRLFIIADEQKRIFDNAPEEQAVFRQRANSIMIALGIFDLALGIFLAVFLTRGITKRLQRVSENTINLAAGLPLLPVLSGNDEIAQLDQVFHKMAAALNEASRKERAVVDNAADFICTLDANNRLIAANPASAALLQVEPAELIGKYVIELISEVHRERALEYFNGLKGKDKSVPVELEMKTASGGTVEGSWSAYWSQEENSIFCVVHDVTERRRIEKLKQEVTAMITHDLRSPLSTVMNVLDFFENLVDKSNDDRGPRYINMARRNTERMLSLINDLLDVEKIKSGNMNIDIRDLSICDCFFACEELTATAAEEVGIKLNFRNTETRVRGDQNLIDRVLTNLVANAIRFTPKGKEVRIFCNELEGFAEIAVEDQGPGIPENEISTVFERFRQLKSGGAKNKGGSGLGLTICKAIVEIHGGKIWVESSGNGSAFIFTLPLAQSRASNAAVTN